MSLPIQLISTDFDGTLHCGFEDPPISNDVVRILQRLQERGATWVINTGRDLPSLLDELKKSQLAIRPDFIVVVEREIYQAVGSDYVSVAEWNDACTNAHEALFRMVRQDMAEITGWIRARYRAAVYEDTYSPFCLIAESVEDAEAIHDYLALYCRRVNDLVVMRNDIYARFCHTAYHKGSALAEIARRLGVSPAQTFAAGDHLNDLPMLSTQYAQWLAAPANAVPAVKEAVRRQNGYISHQAHGHGVARSLEYFLQSSVLFS